MFTYNTYQKTDYSVKGQNITIPEKALGGKTYAVVAVVSLEGALEHYEIYEKSVNTDSFLDYLKSLREHCEDKIALFLDNLRVHHSTRVKEFCEKYDIPLVFNLPYSPEYNPIENFFSLVKNTYRRLKQNDLVRFGKYDPLLLIQESFDRQDVGAVMSICQNGLKKLYI